MRVFVMDKEEFKERFEKKERLRLLEERKLLTKNLSYYLYMVKDVRAKLISVDKQLKEMIENE